MKNILEKLMQLPRAEKIVLLCAAVPAVAVYLFGQMTFYIDSHTYVMNGYYLFQPLQACHYYWRSLGYPAALFFSGLRFGSFEGILLLQMLAAIVMCWAQYRMLLPLSPRFAFWAALGLSATLLPYLFQNTIYQDQLQVVLGFLTAYYLSRLWLDPKPATFARLLIAAGLLTFFRPSLLVMYGVGIAAFVYCLQLLRRRGEDPQSFINIFALVTAGVLLLHVGHAALYSQVFQECQEIGKGGVDDHYRRIGKQIFQNAYMYSYDLPEVFSYETGPATTEITEKTIEFMQSEAMQQRLRDQQHLPMLGQLLYSGIPKEELGRYILTHPHYDYYWLLFFAPVEDSVFSASALEIYTHYPQVLGRILWIGWNNLLFGESALMNGQIDLRYLYLVPNFQPAWTILDHNYTLVPPSLAEELKEHLEYRYITKETSAAINATWAALFKYVSLFVFLMVSYGLLLLPVICLRSDSLAQYGTEAKIFASLCGVMLLQVLPLMLLVQPQFRYHAEAVLLAVPAASVMVWMSWRLFQPQKS